MILNVKLLSSGSASSNRSCDVEAREGDSVESLKLQIEEKLKLNSGTEQKLLFKGKTLQDGTALDAYKLNDGAKLHLMLKDHKTAISSSDTASSTKKAAATAAVASLEEELSRSLRKHFRSEEEAKRVARAFKRGLGETLDRMNSDDVERFCRNLNSGEEAVRF